MEFFSKNPLRNAVMVSTGILSEEVYRWSDFANEVPELRNVELPLEVEKLPPYDPSRDPIIRLFRGAIVFTGFLQIVAAWILFDDDEMPAVALVILGMSGVVTLAVGALASSHTLRRFFTRDPRSLDAR